MASGSLWRLATSGIRDGIRTGELVGGHWCLEVTTVSAVAKVSRVQLPEQVEVVALALRSDPNRGPDVEYGIRPAAGLCSLATRRQVAVFPAHRAATGTAIAPDDEGREVAVLEKLQALGLLLDNM